MARSHTNTHRELCQNTPIHMQIGLCLKHSLHKRWFEFHSIFKQLGIDWIMPVNICLWWPHEIHLTYIVNLTWLSCRVTHTQRPETGQRDGPCQPYRAIHIQIGLCLQNSTFPSTLAKAIYHSCEWCTPYSQELQWLPEALVSCELLTCDSFQCNKMHLTLPLQWPLLEWVSDLWIIPVD